MYLQEQRLQIPKPTAEAWGSLWQSGGGGLGVRGDWSSGLAVMHKFLILGSTFTDTEPQFTHLRIQPGTGVTETNKAQPRLSRSLRSKMRDKYENKGLKGS